MNNCEQIHETVLRDIVDFASDISNQSAEVRMMLTRDKSFKSLNQATSNLILTFPVACSKLLSISTATMISKAIERQAASMLQILFSAVQFDDSSSAIEYVKKYHTNIGSSFDMDEFTNMIDKMSESGDLTIIDHDAYTSVMEDMKNLNFILSDTLSENSINDYKVKNNPYNGEMMICKEARSNPADTMAAISKMHRDQIESLNKQLIATDVKKANELTPTLMIINFINTSGETPVAMNNIVIGVKAKLEPMESSDIINRIIVKNQDNNGLNKIIRAATREISFWKDLVFAIDKAKIDAISNSRRGSSSPMWKVLERRALKSRIRRTIGTKNDASAITTLVISKDEVEYLMKQENINMEDPKVARPIMESYNLMGLVIADEAVETAKFLKDTGDSIYETISFNGLEREASDNTYKKVVNLMSKMS